MVCNIESTVEAFEMSFRFYEVELVQFGVENHFVVKIVNVFRMQQIFIFLMRRLIRIIV